MKTRILKETKFNGEIQYRPQYKSWKTFWFWHGIVDYNRYGINWHLIGKTPDEALDILYEFLHPKPTPHKIIKKEVYSYDEA